MSNIAASSVEHLQFPEFFFIWNVSSQWQIKINNLESRHCILKMLYTRWSTKEAIQCRIQKKFGDVFSSVYGLLSRYQHNFTLFCTFLANSLKLYKMFFWKEHKKAHCLLEKVIKQQQFRFFLFHFEGHFQGSP